MMLADAEDVQAHLVRQLDLFQEVPQPFSSALLTTRIRVDWRLRERVDPDFHGATTYRASAGGTTANPIRGFMGWLSAPPRDPASPLEIRLHSTDRGSDGSSPPGPSTDEPWIQLAALLRDHDGPEDIGRVAAVVSDGWGMRVKDATERWTMAFEEAGQLAGLMW